MRRIEHDGDVTDGLAELVRLDPRLAPIVAASGAVPLRRRPPGFSGLARVVTAQQVSAAAATSIWAKVERVVGADPGPQDFAVHADETLRSAGLSAAKVRTLKAVAGACADGLDLEACADLAEADAIAELTKIKGIGRWTAEVWLLFCAGHPDVWPAGDLALRVAVGDGFGLPERPSEAVAREIAEAWRPWRSVAARLFWAYYAARRDGREGMAR
ncbi:MAG: DNA-3-methyladenine glycosylase [Hyphomicrobiales bacterium]|nr:DNA-3-methyladenine glycosylase [Hyphomicrobiales bacterium]